MYKILSMSDSILLSTGYSTITREIMKRLAKEYDVTHFGWQFVGNPLKFYPDEEVVSYANKPGGIKLLPNPGNHPFGANMLQNYLRMEIPDLFWCLCDSLSEERIVVLKNKENEIEFLTMKEVYDKYGPEPKDVETLSVQVHRTKPFMVHLKDINDNWHDAYSNRTINRGIWTPLLGIARRYVSNYPMRLVKQTYGETECTEKHSLVYDNGGNKLERITPEEFVKDNRSFVKLDTVPDCRTYSVRKMSKDVQMDYARVFGAFVSEGCVNDEQVIFSNSDKIWLEQIRASMRRLFGKNGGYSKSGNVYNLVFWGKEISLDFKNWCGRYSKNKMIPCMVFGFRKGARIEFLKYAIKGDGHIKSNKGTRKMYKNKLSFTYTSNSPKLISGMSFLLTRLHYNHSIRSYMRKTKIYEIYTNSCRKRKVNTYDEKRNYTGYIYDLMTENEIFLDGLGLVATHNSFMLFDWINNIDFAPAKSMFYFPSDGEYFPFGCENVLKKFQYVIAMSKFAQVQIKRLFNIDVDYIPHGISTDFFVPVDENKKRELRAKWGPRMQTDLQDKFVILTVGRNQGRKALPEYLKVIGKFAKGKEDKVRFILHMDPEDPAGIGPPQWIFSLIQRYGLEHVVRFSGTKVWYQFPFEDYREIYQIADIHALATTGEGFGIPTIESQSCGLPNIITDYTTSKELVEEPQTGITVPIGYELTGTWTVERGFVDKEKMYEALETLYKDENLRKEMGKRARENALKYDWNTKIFPIWDRKIKEVLEE